MRILVSGFTPFGGRDVNPTALLIEAIANREIEHPKELVVESVLLPVTFEDSWSILKTKINQFNPDVVISLGQAAGREAIEIESIAVNQINADITDNKGEQPQNKIISDSGPEKYISTLPIFGIEGALKQEGLPVRISNSAGTFVCNYVFYRLMEENQDTQRLCGFIHVPLLPEQARNDEPYLAIGDMKRAISVILNYINY
jgi:pyroglutamyl-peptidase